MAMPQGIKASIRALNVAEEGMNVKVYYCDGKNPDSFAKKQNASDFIAYIEQKQLDFYSLKTKLLLEDAGNDPIKRAHNADLYVASMLIRTILFVLLHKRCSI
jgi:DNA primase